MAVSDICAKAHISLVREALRERSDLAEERAACCACTGLHHSLLQRLGKVLLRRRDEDLRHACRSARNRTIKNIEPRGGAGKVAKSRPERTYGRVVYQDGQFDDTRLLIDILRTAESKSAVVLNYARVTSLTKDETGKMNGVEFQDAENEHRHSVSAKAVINATGAFCSRVQKMSDANLEPRSHIARAFI
jgi:glycerol-3-phosphate dehydrogenase